MNKYTLVCAECGGINVQVEAWVNANTNEFVNDNGDGTYCEDCGENDLDIITFEEYEKNKRNRN